MHWAADHHVFWPLFPFLWVLFLVFVIGGALRFRRYRQWHRMPPFAGPHFGPHFGPNPDPAGHTPSLQNALDLLCWRYARGEIDATTFDQMRERIQSTSRPRYDQPAS